MAFDLSIQLITIDDFAKTLDNKIQVDIGILDFLKTFDKISHPRILHKLNNNGSYPRKYKGSFFVCGQSPPHKREKGPATWANNCLEVIILMIGQVSYQGNSLPHFGSVSKSIKLNLTNACALVSSFTLFTFVGLDQPNQSLPVNILYM